MKIKLPFLLLSVLVGMTACSDNDNPIPEESEDNPIINTAPEPDYSTVICNAPVFVTGSLKPEVRSALKPFLTNISSLDEAEIAIVKDEDIGTYEGKLLDFYNRGGLLVIAEPSTTRYKEFVEKYSLRDVMPCESSQDMLLFVTSNFREHYALFADNPFDVDNGADPVMASIHSKDATTYYKRRLFEIFGWVKSVREQTATTRSDVQVVTGFNPKVLITECDHINFNFPVVMDHCVCDLKGFLYSDEYIDALNCIEVRNTIYSAYVYEGNKNPGDYYIVQSEVIARNKSGWQPFNHNHAGVVTKGAGYFMSQLDVTSELLTNKLKSMSSGVEFFCTPSPGTTIGAKQYNTKTSVGFNGSLSASTSTLGSVGFTAEYGSEETVFLNDVNISLQSGAAKRTVMYSFLVQNISSRDWDNIKAMEKDVPAIAREEFNAKTGWCWRILPNTNDVKDNSTTNFVLSNKINYHYDCMIESNFKQFYTRHHKWNYETYATCSLPHPSRVPFGILSLKNTHSNTISNVTVWKEEDYADKNNHKPVLTFRDSFIKGECAICPLEVGSYVIEYNQIYDNNNYVLSSWVLKDVVIKNGKDQESSTSNESTAFAEKRK